MNGKLNGNPRYRNFMSKHPLIKNLAKEMLFKYVQLTYPIRMFFRSITSHDLYIELSKIVGEVHKETFKGYKNLYAGKEIVIIGTGPSLNKYVPIPDTINIGVNKVLLYDKVTLDYYFAVDYCAIKQYLDKVMTYKNKNLQKFFGIMPAKGFFVPEIESLNIIPESKVIEYGAKKFYIYAKYPPYNVNFNTEIDKTWLELCNSCIFSAMQFALFTNPKRIYIVGCDCTSGYYDENNFKIKPNKDLVKCWKELKLFAQKYYPDTEIISVNPVGLKGIFKDLYQEDEK